jgi:hypothetical protein
MRQTQFHNHIINIENFFSRELDPTVKNTGQDEKYFFDLILNIKTDLNNEILISLKSFEKSLHYVQSNIQQILYKIYFNKDVDKAPFIIDCGLNQLLIFLEYLQLQYNSHYYFNNIVPRLFIDYKIAQVKHDVEKLKKELKGKIDERLEIIIENEVFKASENINYDELKNFIKRILDLSKIFIDGVDESTIENAHFTLIESGLHTPKFLTYCLELIWRQELDSEYELETFMSKWQTCLWVCNYANNLVKDKNAFVKLLEKAINKKNNLIKKKIDNQKTISTSYFQAKVSLVQLLYLFKLWIDADVLEFKSRTSLYHFINKHIETLKVKHPTIGSMQRKYATALKTDKIKIKNFLIVMLNQINQELNSGSKINLNR